MTDPESCEFGKKPLNTDLGPTKIHGIEINTEKRPNSAFEASINFAKKRLVALASNAGATT